jgi:hypothetical protein
MSTSKVSLIQNCDVVLDTKGRIATKANPDGAWSNENVDIMYSKMLEKAKETGHSIKVFVYSNDPASKISELTYKQALSFTKTHLPRIGHNMKFGGSQYFMLVDKDKAPSAVRNVTQKLF